MLSVVVADDEKNIRDSICKVIATACPFVTSVKSFDNGAECLEYLNSHHTDILITDICMQGKSGLDLAAFLQTHSVETKTVIITAYRDFEYAKKALEYRVYDFLVKPFPSKKIVEIVSNVYKQIKSQQNQEAVEKEQYLNNWEFKRKILSTLFDTNNIDSNLKNYKTMRLCCSSKKISQLKCCKFDISVQEETDLEPLVSAIKDLGEIDSPHLSTFYINRSDDSFAFLGFFDDSEKMYAAANDICRGFTAFYKKCASLLIKEYPTIDDLHNSLICDGIIENFISELSTEQSDYALKRLNDKIAYLTDEQNIFLRKTVFERLREDNFVQFEELEENNTVELLLEFANHRLKCVQTNNYIGQMKEYIEKNYSNPDISLETMALALTVSPGHLSRIFKKNFGCNYAAYISSFRMNKACSLLQETSLSSTEISTLVGFRYVEYFRLSFKKYTGLTPSKYRALHSRTAQNNTL